MDAEENLWLSTSAMGLARVTDPLVQDIRLEPNQKGIRVRTLCEQPGGEWLLGAWEEGFQLWSGGVLQPLVPGGFGEDDKGGNALLAMDDGNGVWAAGHYGLYAVGKDRVQRGDGFKELFGEGDSAMALCRDVKGRLLAGTRLGNLYAITGDSWEKLECDTEGFAILNIIAVPDGTIWVGTYGYGVTKIGTTQGHYQYEEGLKSSSVVCSCLDEKGRYWVGTEGGGIAVYQGDRFFNFGPEHGVDIQIVNQIVDDGRGRLWLGGNSSILSLRFCELDAILAGGKERVIPELLNKGPISFPIPCPVMKAIKARDGRLAFGSERGFLLIQPPPLKPWPEGPGVWIQKINVMGQPANPGVQSLKLHPDQNHVEIYWTGLAVKEAEETTFRYRLQGADALWHEVGKDRRAVFAGLAPGEYVLELAARIGNGPWSAEVTQLPVHALPAFWQTGWFQMVVFGAIASGAGTAGYLVDRRKRKHLAFKRAQEKAVESERMRIARDLHDYLGGTMTEMAVYSQLAATSLTPDAEANTYLDRILQSAQAGTRALGEIVWATDPAHDTLASFISQVADMVKAGSPKGTRILLPEVMPTLNLSAGVRQNLYLALKEGLNNLHKHAAAKEVTFGVACPDGFLTITLGDDGCGFDPAQLPSFGSDGLKNMRERMEQAGGSMKVDSKPGEGTTLTFSLPLDRMV